MKKVFLAACLLAVLTGCATQQNLQPLPQVGTVNLDSFLGEWHVLASVPNVIARKPFNATITFTRADRGIDIQYAFNSGSPEGDWKTVNSRAMVDNPGINTDWQVTYPWPFQRDLRIVYLEPDYSVAVMANPNRKDIWILARQPAISAPLYSDIVLFLQQLGYDVGKFRRIPQS